MQALHEVPDRDLRGRGRETHPARTPAVLRSARRGRQEAEAHRPPRHPRVQPVRDLRQERLRG